MILNNIQEKRVSIKKDLKRSVYKYCISILINMAVVFGGGFIFWYIEQCYDPQLIRNDHQTSTVMDHNHAELCIQIKNEILNSTVQNLSDTINSHNQTPTNLSIVEPEADRLREKLGNLTSQFCQASSPKVVEDRKKCSLNVKDISSWWSYTMSICFTIGNNLKFFFESF